METGGGWMWGLMNVIGVAILGVAIAYGTLTWRRRKSRPLERVGDAQTKKLYEGKDADE